MNMVTIKSIKKKRNQEKDKYKFSKIPILVESAIGIALITLNLFASKLNKEHSFSNNRTLNFPAPISNLPKQDTISLSANLIDSSDMIRETNRETMRESTNSTALDISTASEITQTLVSSQTNSTQTILTNEFTNKVNYIVPVLMYHQVVKDPKYISRYCITVEELEKQLNWLKEKGYAAAVPKDFYKFYDIETKTYSIDKNQIILTFDDVNMNFYKNVYPLLKKYNTKALAFVIINDIGKMSSDKILTWDKIKEMHSSGLIQFGSHTMDHKKLSKLTEIELNWELQKSKKILEDKLDLGAGGSNIIAWPGGTNNKNVREMAQRVGYRYAFSCDEYNSFKPWGEGDLGRQEIYGTWDLTRFEKMMQKYERANEKLYNKFLEHIEKNKTK